MGMYGIQQNNYVQVTAVEYVQKMGDITNDQHSCAGLVNCVQ